MDQYEDKLQGYEEELSKRPETNREVAALKDQLKDLERKLADREDMLQEAQAAAEEALNRLVGGWGRWERWEVSGRKTVVCEK